MREGLLSLTEPMPKMIPVRNMLEWTDQAAYFWEMPSWTSLIIIIATIYYQLHSHEKIIKNVSEKFVWHMLENISTSIKYDLALPDFDV